MEGPEEEDPWAPLSAEELARRPGERPEPPSGATSCETRPKPVCPMPGSPKVRSPNEAGEKMLRALQDRIANAGNSDSMITEVQNRERRDARKQQQADRVAEALAANLVDGKDFKPGEPGPEIVYETGADGRDEREDSEWFQGLPEAEQRRLQLAWQHKRELASNGNRAQRRNGNRRMVTAWFCAALVFLLGSHMLWRVTLGAGVLVGFWWRQTGPDRALDAVRALTGFFVAHGVAMAIGGSVVASALWMDALLFAAFGCLIGFEGEIRRSGGFDTPAPKSLQ